MTGYREKAVDVLNAFFSGSVARLAPERDRIFREGLLPEQNHGVFNDVLFGIVRRYRSLDALIDTFSDHPLSKLDRTVHDILRLAVYEILFLDAVPEGVAVNEAVELGKNRSTTSSGKFINAVLRSVLRSLTEERWEVPSSPTASGIEHLFPVRDLRCREFSKPVMPSPHDGPDAVVRYVSTVFNYPEWVIQRWLDGYGRERTWEIARHQVRVPPLVIRRNARASSEETFRSRFDERDIPIEETETPGFYRVLERRAPDELPGYDEGLFTVQDPVQGAALDLLDLQGASEILDLCAAPGGKTTQVPARCSEQTQVIAADLDRDRLGRLRENLERLKLNGVDLLCADGRRPPFRKASFDAVILDVPCSNTGVLSSRVEARYHLSDGSPEGLVSLQRSLLERGLSLLGPEGRLLYATCSLLPDENERVADSAAAARPDVTLERSETTFPTERQPTGGYAAVLVRGG